jgi:hypothetical protein
MSWQDSVSSADNGQTFSRIPEVFNFRGDLAFRHLISGLDAHDIQIHFS